MTQAAALLKSSRRVVIKVGSALVADGETGEPDRAWLKALTADAARMAERGQQLLIVSSGAVALGRRRLGLGRRPLDLPQKQAAAAAGQSLLMRAWEEALEPFDLAAAQVLLTRDDTEVRHRWLNGKATLDTLLGLGVVPIVNENDTVATEEIRYGDNDRLAARVAQMIGADLLVLLSDVDGLYTADPRVNPAARRLDVISELTPEIEAMAGDPGSSHGSGGMVTKLMAARIALAAGCRMAIAPGAPLHPLKAMKDGGRCTWFLPSSEPLTARKQWIAGSVQPQGTLVADTGACRALKTGGSLLPAGVTAVEGEFQKGEAVVVVNAEGRAIARGLVAYSSDDARLIIRRKSAAFEELLGYRGPDVLIHRDDLVLDS